MHAQEIEGGADAHQEGKMAQQLEWSEVLEKHAAVGQQRNENEAVARHEGDEAMARRLQQEEDEV